MDTRIGLLRVTGALLVFAYHFMGDAEAVLRSPLAANTAWRLVRDGSGSYGVSIFIVISGIVFSWAWPRAKGAASFVRRRLVALFPFFWWVAVPMIALALIVHRMAWQEIWKVPLWLTGLGLLSPTTFFPVVSAWWYMTLALQFACLYPLLRRLQDRAGVDVFLLVCSAVAVASVWALQGLGLQYLTLGFAGCRLLEFAIGMTAGRLMEPGKRARLPARSWAVVGLAAGGYVAATPAWASSIVVAPLFVLLVLVLMKDAKGTSADIIGNAAALSFAFYLSHSPWAKSILSALPRDLPSVWAVLLGAALSLLVAVVIAALFRWSFVSARRVLRKAVVHLRRPRVREETEVPFDD
jgi:peptidoglycan/LPS O-acetylase OafA/YrhL